MSIIALYNGMAIDDDEVAMNTNEYPMRCRLEEMPFDFYDRSAGFCHATGWEIRISSDMADWWNEYIDPRTGEIFLAR